MPEIHSSAVIAGTSPGVSGYRSSWNSSDYKTLKWVIKIPDTTDILKYLSKKYHLTHMHASTHTQNVLSVHTWHNAKDSEDHTTQNNKNHILEALLKLSSLLSAQSVYNKKIQMEMFKPVIINMNLHDSMHAGK